MRMKPYSSFFQFFWEKPSKSENAVPCAKTSRDSRNLSFSCAYDFLSSAAFRSLDNLPENVSFFSSACKSEVADLNYIDMRTVGLIIRNENDNHSCH